MSAFVVAEETINCVVTAMNEDHRLSGEQLDELGGKLWQMNADAVNARYSEKSGAPICYAHRTRAYTLVQQYKATCCYLYQCSEGDVPQTELFKHVEDLSHRLAARIVSQLPEYQNSQWDLR